VHKSVQVPVAVRQCDVASGHWSGEDCCGGYDEQYDIPLSLSMILTELERLQGYDEGVASFEVIQSEIEDDRPVCARIAWNANAAHFVAIGGWRIKDGEQQVLVLDPQWGSRQVTLEEDDWWIPYDDLRLSYRCRGIWVHTHFVKERYGNPINNPSGDPT
jgi:hypothetical protein